MAQDIKTVQNIDQVPVVPSEGSISALVSPSAVASDSPMDAVSSLRALALSTMRSKRRKGSVGSQSVSSKPLPARPAAAAASASSDIDMLDYGSEEAQNAQDTPNPSNLADKHTSIHKQATEHAMDVEEEVREEGEISDEDLQTSSSSSSGTHVNGTMPVTKPLSKHPNSPQPIAPVSALSSVGNQSTAHSNLRNIVHAHGAWNNWVPEPNHVRPGLKMNMEQFNLVKELVLDLLGWGVSPEYLVDCGLTREAVFYTFTELNLRLPKNLDVSGLSPFPPPTIVAAAEGPQQSNGNSAMPPPPSIPHREAPSVHARRPSLGHPLPAKPIGVVGEAPTSPTVSTNPSPVNNTNGHNLSDMEAQRRQELQARKAVLATRKKKGTPSAYTEQGTSSTLPTPQSTAAHNPGTVDAPIPVVPTEAVDDFLKSMLENAAPPCPASHPTRLRALSGGVALGINHTMVSPVSPGGMDIDSDDIPGLGSYQTQKRQESLRSSSSKSPSPRDTAFAASTSTITEARITRSPSISGETQVLSMPSTPTSPLVPDYHGRNDHTVTSNGFTPSVHATNGKRGSKRPVAMDFVDVDQNTSGTTRTVTNAVPAHLPYVRRKTGSFAGLGANISRRCVIDVSDSEEDEPSGRSRGGEVQASEVQNQNVSRADSNTPGSRPVYVCPPSLPGSVPSKPASPGVLTPETLMEKEKEIKRMKELIAQRELGRLKKLAEKSRTPAGTPPPSSGSTSVQGKDHPTSTEIPVMVKVEEVDNAPLSTSAIFEGKVEVVRSQSDSGSASDRADEDAVVQDLIEPVIKKNAFEHYSTGESGEFYVESPSSRQTVPKDAASAMPMDADSITSPTVLSDTIALSASQKAMIPDLRPLRVAVTLREMGNNLQRRVCQYELPGGGVCRDKTCADVHLNDLEPDDHETARYLIETMPDILQTYNESEVVDQLLQARQKKAAYNKAATQDLGPSTISCSLEATVAEAVAALVGDRR
ncbi:hypothetical protein EW145_g6976 [Phellinidium pouzarii]|uniref:Zinc-finger domain-containing protein n=1 Tax=Phellinidium pouzarii TaxID=167371 RepID=A0A4S4KSX7_9AGAM|nr:hypothetical protein EW145_g6976 [Phellinidium pouzarii]